MADQSIACPSCGRKIPLTRALRAEITTSLKQEFEDRERQLRESYDRRRDEDLQRAWKEAATIAEKQIGDELITLRERVSEQQAHLDDARRVELTLRKKERELERSQRDLEVTVARLRRRIAGDGLEVSTVHRRGYRLVAADDD